MVGRVRVASDGCAIWCLPISFRFQEDKRDYDMRRLAREEKLKGKKLRGKRNGKEETKEKVGASAIFAHC